MKTSVSGYKKRVDLRYSYIETYKTDSKTNYP